VHDELGEYRVAPNMALGKTVQLVPRYFAHDIPKVELRLGQLLDLSAARRAKIAAFASGHCPSSYKFTLTGGF
jgi:hypothetical protein